MRLRAYFASVMMVLSFNCWADGGLVEKVKTEQVAQLEQQKAREARFAQQEKELTSLKRQLEAEKRRLTETNKALSESFSRNEKRLSALEQELTLESGSLGEVFGVARQQAKELSNELKSTLSGAGQADVIADLDQLLESDSQPNLEQITQLWLGFEQQIEQSALLQAVAVDVVAGDGMVGVKQALKIGSIALVDNGGYLDWDGQLQQARSFGIQPSGGATLSMLSSEQANPVKTVVIDPTRGQLLTQLTLTPALMDRIKAGGVVGGIILAILSIGLIIALVRGGVLWKTQRQISAQLRQPDRPSDNPLGRVLSVYSSQPNRTVEALELRLLEVILDEQAKLEKGLSMLKLLAALAPMLGLLGTVTGMIETFQVITLFGSGDAKMMAGGISMALVTTVMGLVAAMPLLLAHNVLSTQSENLRNLLEKQGIALVAEQAEQAMGFDQRAVAS
tara:strand:- start:253 stop:1602 length:1350 start_codon:yes stop_codon:yes gene_type:complete